jgi:hypothetical protein
MNVSSHSLSRIVFLCLGVAACGGGRDTGADASAAITVANAGFATPESVLHDESADIYLVSNINGMPLGEDDNGFISRVSPEGEVLELKWIDGAAADVTLNAPKGMAIADGTLYVADIDCVRRFDQSSGAPAGEFCVPGASFLNDVAPAPGGGVYVTDTGLDASFSPSGTDAVYRIVGDQFATVVAASGLGAPNGIIATDEGILVVTFMSGEVFRLDADGGRTSLVGGGEGQFDGVGELADGRVLVSSWGNSCVYLMDEAGALECAVAGVEAPADIGVDRTRNRVLIPLFNANEVRIEPMG